MSQRQAWLALEAGAQCSGGWHSAAALTEDLRYRELEKPALEEKHAEFAES